MGKEYHRRAAAATFQPCILPAAYLPGDRGPTATKDDTTFDAIEAYQLL
jgi:hypothetical protein